MSGHTRRPTNEGPLDTARRSSGIPKSQSYGPVQRESRASAVLQGMISSRRASVGVGAGVDVDETTRPRATGPPSSPLASGSDNGHFSPGRRTATAGSLDLEHARNQRHEAANEQKHKRRVTSASMGFRETDAYISKMAKENFDLKLSLYQTTQQVDVLHKKLERMDELEKQLEEIENMEHYMKQAISEQDTLIAENEELRAANGRLTEVVETREELMEEAVRMICELQATVESLRTERKPSACDSERPTVQNSSSPMSNAGTVIQRSPSLMSRRLDIPERKSSSKATRRLRHTQKYVDHPAFHGSERHSQPSSHSSKQKFSKPPGQLSSGKRYAASRGDRSTCDTIVPSPRGGVSTARRESFSDADNGTSPETEGDEAGSHETSEHQCGLDSPQLSDCTSTFGDYLNAGDMSPQAATATKVRMSRAGKDVRLVSSSASPASETGEFPNAGLSPSDSEELAAHERNRQRWSKRPGQASVAPSDAAAHAAPASDTDTTNAPFLTPRAQISFETNQDFHSTAASVNEFNERRDASTDMENDMTRSPGCRLLPKAAAFERERLSPHHSHSAEPNDFFENNSMHNGSTPHLTAPQQQSPHRCRSGSDFFNLHRQTSPGSLTSNSEITPKVKKGEAIRYAFANDGELEDSPCGRQKRAGNDSARSSRSSSFFAAAKDDSHSGCCLGSSIRPHMHEGQSCRSISKRAQNRAPDKQSSSETTTVPFRHKSTIEHDALHHTDDFVSAKPSSLSPLGEPMGTPGSWASDDLCGSRLTLSHSRHVAARGHDRDRSSSLPDNRSFAVSRKEHRGAENQQSPFVSFGEALRMPPQEGVSNVPHVPHLDREELDAHIRAAADDKNNSPVVDNGFSFVMAKEQVPVDVDENGSRSQDDASNIYRHVTRLFRKRGDTKQNQNQNQFPSSPPAQHHVDPLTPLNGEASISSGNTGSKGPHDVTSEQAGAKHIVPQRELEGRDRHESPHRSKSMSCNPSPDVTGQRQYSNQQAAEGETHPAAMSQPLAPYTKHDPYRSPSVTSTTSTPDPKSRFKKLVRSPVSDISGQRRSSFSKLHRLNQDQKQEEDNPEEPFPGQPCSPDTDTDTMRSRSWPRRMSLFQWMRPSHSDKSMSLRRRKDSSVLKSNNTRAPDNDDDDGLTSAGTSPAAKHENNDNNNTDNYNSNNNNNNNNTQRSKKPQQPHHVQRSASASLASPRLSSTSTRRPSIPSPLSPPPPPPAHVAEGNRARSIIGTSLFSGLHGAGSMSRKRSPTTTTTTTTTTRGGGGGSSGAGRIYGATMGEYSATVTAGNRSHTDLSPGGNDGGDDGGSGGSFGRSRMDQILRRNKNKG